jgi:IS30 family transposase
MTIKSDTLKEAKSALRSMSKKSEKRLTRADFIASLIKEIHEKMEAGFSIAEICEELNRTLPDDQKIKMNTFKTYVRKAREEAGIKPLRSWTRRIEVAPKKSGSDASKEEPKRKTETDFRDQGGDL